jgi:NADH-quinone oxidoreductase subunit N
VRVIVVMFFSESSGAGPTVAIPSILTTVTITIGATMTFVLGVVPQPVLDLARQAGDFIR